VGSKGEELVEGIRKMLTVGTDTGGSFSQPPSWRSQEEEVIRSRETEGRETQATLVSSVYGMATVAREGGLMI